MRLEKSKVLTRLIRDSQFRYLGQADLDDVGGVRKVPDEGFDQGWRPPCARGKASWTRIGGKTASLQGRGAQACKWATGAAPRAPIEEVRAGIASALSAAVGARATLS